VTAPVRLPADTPIAFLAVSRRTLGFLDRNEWATVGQLAGATDKELRDVRGIGPVALHEIRGALAAAGYPRGGAR
jgi:DNA-directed RNA polymerase alpha subunit